MYDPKTKTFQDIELNSMSRIHRMIDSLGLLEGNLLQELTYLTAKEPANVKLFMRDLVRRVNQYTKRNKLYGNDKEVNQKIDNYVKETIKELAEKHNVSSSAMELGSVFMSSTENI